jgi:hypothetical protein
MIYIQMNGLYIIIISDPRQKLIKKREASYLIIWLPFFESIGMGNYGIIFKRHIICSIDKKTSGKIQDIRRYPMPVAVMCRITTFQWI